MLFSLGVKAQCWLTKISNFNTNFTQHAKWRINLWRIDLFLDLNFYFCIEKRTTSESVSFQHIGVRI